MLRISTLEELFIVFTQWEEFMKSDMRIDENGNYRRKEVIYWSLDNINRNKLNTEISGNDGKTTLTYKH